MIPQTSCPQRALATVWPWCADCKRQKKSSCIATEVSVKNQVIWELLRTRKHWLSFHWMWLQVKTGEGDSFPHRLSRTDMGTQDHNYTLHIQGDQTPLGSCDCSQETPGQPFTAATLIPDSVCKDKRSTQSTKGQPLLLICNRNRPDMALQLFL